VATSAKDHAIIIWDGMLFSPSALVEIQCPAQNRPMNALAFSDTGEFLAAAQGANVLILLVAHGSLVTSIEGHTSPIQAVCFSPCERYVATASIDRTARLWSVRDGSLLWTFVNHDATVSHVVFSADGKTLVSADKSGRVCVHALCMFVRDAPLCLG
ncbi:WD40-repeat-containing domain protein, partial [Cerioporus squamosus]